MKYVNAAGAPMKFELGGKVYEVEVGGTCEIPDRLDYAVARMGLRLARADQAPAVKPLVVQPSVVQEAVAEPEPPTDTSKKKR